MAATSSKTDRTFVTVFHLTDILLRDKLDDGEDINENTIRQNIEIALNGLSESRKAVVIVDLERMVLRFAEIYDVNDA
jgi:hypothetical protein